VVSSKSGTTTETLALQAVLSNAEQLKLSDPDQALMLYTRHVDRIRRDFDAGKQEAMQAIGACRGDVEAAELILRVGVAIAKADRQFTASERSMIEEISRAVGIEGLDMTDLVGGVTPTRH
jgi:tellurite resistance protein TerB